MYNQPNKPLFLTSNKLIMSFKQLMFQAVIILFIIGFSSCEKGLESKFGETTQLNSLSRLGNNGTVEITFVIDKNISNRRVLKVVEDFLTQKDLSSENSTNREWEEILSNSYILNEESEQFERLNSKIEKIEYSINRLSNHFIRINDVEWEINMNNGIVASATGAVTIVIVSTIDGPDTEI